MKRAASPLGCGAGLLATAFAVLCALLAPAGAAAAEPIAYPDLRVLMPTEDMSVMHINGRRLLEFTHITEDAGAGPLEMRPSYNATTGISQGYQALYTMPTPGVWKFAQTVPIVGPMIWTPPSDYNFPLDKFWLYGLNAEGGPGSVVATSPKDLFCMTSDTYVGGVPNTPLENQYPGGACTEPEGRLGLTVGWGDQYEATDGGEGIDITGLPANGTYWLRGEVDPYHYLAESNTSNNITDTKLQIEGDIVRALEQTHPDSTPPSVAVSGPAPEASVSGTVPLSATASGPAAVSSVQFLLDGQPIGAPVTSPPYTLNWTVGATPPGKHFLSAQATDSRGFVGTAADMPITVAARVGSVTIANVVSATGESTVTTAPFSTSQGGDVLLAFADSDGPAGGGQTLSVSGAGLSWSLVRRANAQAGDAEIWAATASAPLSGTTVSATAGDGGYHASLTVAALSGAAGIGTSAAAGAPNGAPTISLTSTRAGSVAFATGSDWDGAVARTLGAGQEMLAQDLDSAAGNTFWSQYARTQSTAGGQTMMLTDTGPTSDRFNLAAVEVLPAAASGGEPPKVSIVNPVGAETVSESTPVSATVTDAVAISSVQFYVDGRPLGAPVTQAPYAVSWNTREVPDGPHTLTAAATDSANNIGYAAPVEVTVENPLQKPPCFVVDATASAEGSTRVTAPPITTAEAGEQLFAFVSADGPAGAEQQAAKISGGGLAWRLLARANSQPGDAEIWTAQAHKPLKRKRIKSTLTSRRYAQLLTVIAVQMSNGAGASASAGAASGPPAVSMLTSEEGSLVYGVGSDWSGAAPRSLGVNQVLLREQLDARSGKTFWSQYLGEISGPAGEVVTLNDTAPNGDRWNMASVEIRGDGPGN